MGNQRASPDLGELRDAIEDVDRRLLECFRERMRLSEQIAAVKIQQAVPFRDQLREEQVLTRVRQTAAELQLDPHQMEHLYRLIMEMSITHQQTHIAELSETPLRLSYQGVEGSFSHLTAQRRYAGRPGGVILRGFETFRRAAETVLDGSADAALLPIENSTAGSINETYDLLAEGGLVINAEEITAIRHCLLGLPGAEIGRLQLVISHPQALMQCEAFLHRLPGVRSQPEFDTAGAAHRVKQGNDPTVAAIASETAATVFGLEILQRDIQNQSANFTRFVEVAREAATCPPDRPCKTSLLLATGHRPGDLGEVLLHFANRSVNIAKLESRPMPGQAWQYRFYLDVEGHAQSQPIRDALSAIEPLTRELRILGTYPQATLPVELAVDGTPAAPAAAPSP